MSEKPPMGSIVKAESGKEYPVVGYEQGGRCVQLPTMPGGATEQFFHENVEVVDPDPSAYAVYRRGLNHARQRCEDDAADDITERLAALIEEGYINSAGCVMLFATVGEEVATDVADRLE